MAFNFVNLESLPGLNCLLHHLWKRWACFYRCWQCFLGWFGCCLWSLAGALCWCSLICKFDRPFLDRINDLPLRRITILRYPSDFLLLSRLLSCSRRVCCLLWRRLEGWLDLGGRCTLVIRFISGACRAKFLLQHSYFIIFCRQQSFLALPRSAFIN